MKIIKFSIFLALFIFAGVAGLRIAHAASVQTFYSGIPMSFTKNIGQTDSRVSFSAPGKNCTLFFTKSGTTILLHREKQSVSVKLINPITPDTEILRASMRQQNDEKEYESFAVKVNFQGANPNPEISGENELSGKSNYFIGADSTQWKTDVPSYGKIRLKNLYDGIDLVYYSGGSGLKYDFVVSAGKDPSKIALGYDLGANVGNALSIDSGGSLTLHTPFGEIVEKTPVCYQTIKGQRVLVEASYRIIDPESNMYGFSIGSYDSKYDLCIDPELGYSCYIGGNLYDRSNDIAVDKDGNAYVTGDTGFSGFPSTPGPFQNSNDVGGCFILKINKTGSDIVYSDFIGASNDGNSIAIDYEGCAYVAGYAHSYSKLPITSAAYDKTFNNGDEIFFIKLNSSGDSVKYCSYFGGSNDDEISKIIVDNKGCLFITGKTTSSNTTGFFKFPITSGAADTVFDGTSEGFITKFNADGSGLVYSTYIGGSDDNGYDKGLDIKVDNSGNAYVLGIATTQNFPVTIGAYDINKNNPNKSFIVKLNADGSQIIYATFLKNYGSMYETKSLALDKEGCVYAVGDSVSIRPQTITNTYSGANKSSGILYNYESFIIKLNKTGTASEYLFKLKDAHFCDIVLDDTNNAYILCNPNSSSLPITSDAYDSTYNGQNDYYLLKLNAEGNQILYSTYFGSSSHEGYPSIAIDRAGNIYLSGEINSLTGRNFPTTPGAYTTTSYGNSDIFIAKFIFNPVIPSVEEHEKAQPEDFLLTNSPNPFNPTTTIEYSIPKETRVALKIYNITGQEIAVLRDGIESAGSHSVVWDAKGMPSGVYFCSMKAEGYTETKKMMLVR